MRGPRPQVDDLVQIAHDAFEASGRRSLTSALTRSLLAVHALLAEENALLPEDERTLASGVSAALRPSGLYLAQMGDGLFGNTRLGTLWARSWEADETMLTLSGGLSPDAAPRVTTEFFPLGTGDAFLLLPGVYGNEVAEEWLSAALDPNPDLRAVGELLRAAAPTTAGVVIWWPVHEEDVVGAHWTRWSSAPGTALLPSRPTPQAAVPTAPPEQRGAPAAELIGEPPEASIVVPPPAGPEAPSVAAAGRATVESASWDLAAEPTGATREPTTESELATPDWRYDEPALDRPTRREPRNPFASNPRAAALGGIAALIVVVLVGVGLIRGLTPDNTVAEASALVNRAAGTNDRNTAVGYLDEAIVKLQPRAGREQTALNLLNNAQSFRDRLLDVVRVGEIERFALPPAPGGQTRPLGLWKTDDSLFILDLGAQLLYRADLNGTRLETAVKPGDSYADQPLGRFVSGAYSPPRGVNTDGRLLLVDTARSILSISPSGTRRWWPPDGEQWSPRIGPIAATFDDLYVLDVDKAQIWQYPARVALARSTVAATARDEPRLSQAVDLAADGNLYLLFPDGAIRKLAPGGGGLPFDGRVPGLPLSAPIALFAHPDLDRVWVLEPVASRVLEFTTGGEYARQYIFPPNVVRQGVGLHIDPQTEELRVLTSEHVLSVKMR